MGKGGEGGGGGVADPPPLLIFNSIKAMTMKFSG